MAAKINWVIPVDHRDYNRMPASVWIRCLQLIPYLRDRGIESTVNATDSDAAIDIFVRMQSSEACDLAKSLKAKDHKIVLDLCVNYLNKDAATEQGENRITLKHFDEARQLAEISDSITCASEVIAKTAAEYCSKARYITDSIDNKHFSFNKPSEDFERRKLRAIWSGVSTKADELEPILPLLTEHGIELVVISDKPPKLRVPGPIWKRSFKYQFRQWTYETFPKEIIGGEICVSHRDMSTQYNQGHSIFKIGVFMAEGVPVIASPQPSYVGMLQGELSGSICNTISDWDRELKAFVTDRSQLASRSSLCRQAIEPYMTHNVIEQYTALIAELME